MLKPMDIHNKEFKKSVRGYDAEEVDEFLDEIIIDFEKMQRELDLLRNQLNSYSENMNSYRDKETALNNALVSAQQFADQLKRDAEEKATRIILEAEEQAKEIIGTTEKKYKIMLADYNALANRYQEAKETLKDYFEHQIQMLDKNEPKLIKQDNVSLFESRGIEKEPVKQESISDTDEPKAATEMDILEKAAAPTLSRRERQNGTNITATYFARSVSKSSASQPAPTVLSDLEAMTENEDTKVSAKMKEMVDARLYDEENQEPRF